jgi:hypothetical protein
MRTLAIALFLGAVALGQGPQRAPSKQSVPPRKTPAGTPKAAPVLDPDEGSVSNDTYTNRFFGFEYTFPDHLDVQDQADFMGGQLDQSSRSFVLLAAFGPAPDGSGAEGVVLLADNAAGYPGLADAAAYLDKVTRPAAEKQRFELVTPARPVDLAGQKFFRIDFRRDEVLQSSIFTLRRGYALGFTLVAHSPEQLQRLLDSLQTLKFTGIAKPAGLPR